MFYLNNEYEEMKESNKINLNIKRFARAERCVYELRNHHNLVELWNKVKK